MKIIGLTGPTGAGKSTVSARLRERGFYIADGDAIAREVVAPGEPLLAHLAEAFGADILEDGVLRRRELARRAFAGEDTLQTLNRLMHPAIEKRMFERIAAHSDCTAAVIDAAALIESGIYKRCNLVAVVTAPLEVRLARIMARDGLCEADAMVRIGAQHPEAFYTEKADVVLRNYPPYSIEAEIQKLLERLNA
ncbi:MAG: dephospho-CoA kinase [Acutalibacteraceae bacterium]